MDRVRPITVRATDYGEDGRQRRIYNTRPKADSEPLEEFNLDGRTQAAIESLPVLVTTDELLSLPLGSPESARLSGELLAMVRA